MSNPTTKFSITFDIDWAPDFAIQFCLDLLDKYQLKGTFFATHHTHMNREIELRGHTLGIHPNFLPNSSQGDTVAKIIEQCLNYSPNAWCMRTHALVQSSPLLYEIFKEFPQLTLDASLFMHRSLYAHKCEWQFDDVRFERLLYNWEDDAEFGKQRFDENAGLHFGQLTVYDFHPIHVYLNSSDGSEYQQLKSVHAGQPLFTVDADSACQFVNQRTGVQTFFKRVLESQAQSVGLEQI